MQKLSHDHSQPQNTRQSQIAELVSAHGFFTIEALAQHFNVTVQTIRSDVNRLCQVGQLRRYHGGAGPISTLDNATFEKRRIVGHQAKQQIAAAVAANIPDRASMFVHYGTTMEALGAALQKREGLLIVTNNLSVAHNSRRPSQTRILLAGGEVATNERCTYGEGALAFLRQFNVDFGLLSVGSVDTDGTLYEYGMEVAETARLIMENSKQVFLAVDSGKFNRRGLVKLGHIRNVSAVFTNRPLPPKISELLSKAGVPVHIARASGARG